MLTRRFKALLFRLGLIQHEIDAEQTSPQPDPIRLFRLKRLRQVLRDGMHRIARALAAERRRAGFRVIGPAPAQGGAR